jgi:hypothetical protein
LGTAVSACARFQEGRHVCTNDIQTLRIRYDVDPDSIYGYVRRGRVVDRLDIGHLHVA